MLFSCSKCANLFLRSHASVQKKKSTEQTIWCVEFNKFLKPSETPMFAAAYGRMISIFRCPTEGQIKYVSCYEDPDVTITPMKWNRRCHC